MESSLALPNDCRWELCVNQYLPEAWGPSKQPASRKGRAAGPREHPYAARSSRFCRSSEVSNVAGKLHPLLDTTNRNDSNCMIFTLYGMLLCFTLTSIRFACYLMLMLILNVFHAYCFESICVRSAPASFQNITSQSSKKNRHVVYSILVHDRIRNL